MDIKLKDFSHLLITKIIVFIVLIACFTGVIITAMNVEVLNKGQFRMVFEDNYFQSNSYIRESENIVGDLTRLIRDYKNEEHILSGATINEHEMRNEEERLYADFLNYSRRYNPELGREKNFEIFREDYADKILQARDKLIKDELKDYNLLLQKIKSYQDPLFYASDGVNEFTNTNITKEDFKNYPSYFIFENYQTQIYPKEVQENRDLSQITWSLDPLDPEKDAVYVAFTQEFLDSRMEEWKQDKAIAVQNSYWLAGLLIGLIISLLYLVLVIGRRGFRDHALYMTPVDRIYNDVNVVLCISLFATWIVFMEEIDLYNIYLKIILLTVSFASVLLVLVLSLIKHIKNRTLLKHTLIFSIFYKLFIFIRDVYDSGSVGVKIVLIVIGYPVLVALTFFMFPITIFVAAWLALKRVKSFNAIKEGVERIKDGDIYHTIDVGGNGEFGRLAANINSITDGLNKAVKNELKSERLKTELITNVSHDIRTPLTSIITYVDLLKKEEKPEKIQEYIEVLDQKSQRLKILTDDLFEAAKASSGSIPVNLERIDIVSLITQGLGEINDKIEAVDLAFKINHPEQQVFITADGKLLWRAIENLLSNILKYALRGSRVYIDIEDLGNQMLLTIKNISAYELNITADELMERFTRGDESRNSNGSGLGLSIAKSLIENQKGKFSVQVDGDLFKVLIYMPKHEG